MPAKPTAEQRLAALRKWARRMVKTLERLGVDAPLPSGIALAAKQAALEEVLRRLGP